MSSNFSCCGAQLITRNAASSTFQDLGKEFGITYGSGSAQGVLGEDRVLFSGFEVNQTFGEQCRTVALTSAMLNR